MKSAHTHKIQNYRKINQSKRFDRLIDLELFDFILFWFLFSCLVVVRDRSWKCALNNPNEQWALINERVPIFGRVLSNSSLVWFCDHTLFSLEFSCGLIYLRSANFSKIRGKECIKSLQRRDHFTFSFPRKWIWILSRSNLMEENLFPKNIIFCWCGKKYLIPRRVRTFPMIDSEKVHNGMANCVVCTVCTVIFFSNKLFHVLLFTYLTNQFRGILGR